MKNIIKDTSNLTSISTVDISKLMDKMCLCIEDSVYEAFLNKEDAVELYVGIGKITIKIDESDIKYRFTPTKQLDNNIKEAILSGKTHLETKLENAIVNKILKTYKDLF